jgi:hypothetical protein
LVTVVVPISLLRGLPWLPLSSLMSILSNLFVPQTDFLRAHNATQLLMHGYLRCLPRRSRS